MTFNKTEFEFLFAYNWHTRTQLLDFASQLSQADYHANPGYGHGSIHDLFFHAVRTEQGWRLGLETGQQLPPSLTKENCPTLETIQAAVTAEKQAYQALLEKLSAEEIEGMLSLTDRRGNTHNFPRWRILQHLILHGMQHHTEIAQLLTTKGKSPGDIDFIFFG